MEKDRRSEIAGDEGEWWGGGGDSVQQAMRAHCPNYNEASYFFRAERSRSICPRQRRLDDSGPLPGLASETKCKRIVGTSPSSRIGQNEKRTAARKWKMKKESERERVGFSAGTSQFSQPFMVPTDFFGLFSRLIHTSPHEIRSSIPTCIISEDTGESSFSALCHWVHRYVCAGPFGFHCSLPPC